MSRLTDYSKFDHIDSGDEDEHDKPKAAATAAAAAAEPSFPGAAPPPDLRFCRSTVPNSNRFLLMHGDRLVYEWEQTLNDVTIYILTPPQIVMAASDLFVRMQPQHLQVGNTVQGQLYLFLDEATAGKVQIESSTWTWESSNSSSAGGLLTIELSKAQKGIVWEAACFGPPPRNIRLDPLQLEQERQRLLLERWQEENPGMDFRGATFNGQAPDPRTFMGGVSYK